MKHAREKHLGDSILAFLKMAGLHKRYEENLAIAFWDTTVGKQIAGHTEPRKVVKGIMFVKVDSDVWRNELYYLKNEIIQQLNRHVGKQAINEIKFI